MFCMMLPPLCSFTSAAIIMPTIIMALLNFFFLMPFLCASICLTCQLMNSTGLFLLLRVPKVVVVALFIIYWLINSHCSVTVTISVKPKSQPTTIIMSHVSEHHTFFVCNTTLNIWWGFLFILIFFSVFYFV